MKIIVALGGNALQKGNDISPSQQLQVCRETVKNVVNLIKEGHDIAIVHGNGPQVGELIAVSETAHKADETRILYSLDICTAFTQGYIGYHLQNTLNEELRHAGINKKSATIVTQVEVHEDDPAFKSPSKPIGRFYTEQEAQKLMRSEGFTMVEDAGRGWRRVVPSPKPLNIVEKDIVEYIFKSGNIAISCGGGIPVVKKDDVYQGIEAVIDKDYAAAKLAEVLKADVLMILTEVDEVYINFNKPNQEALRNISSKELETYIEQGQFAKGSMLPKILASKSFVESGENKKALITSLSRANEAIRGEAGTLISYR